MTDSDASGRAPGPGSDTPYDEGLIAELSEEDRQKLPPEWHRPHWHGVLSPPSWICTVCWGEGWLSSWPCAVAAKDGRKVAEAAGLGWDS